MDWMSSGYGGCSCLWIPLSRATSSGVRWGHALCPFSPGILFPVVLLYVWTHYWINTVSWYFVIPWSQRCIIQDHRAMQYFVVQRGFSAEIMSYCSAKPRASVSALGDITKDMGPGRAFWVMESHPTPWQAITVIHILLVAAVAYCIIAEGLNVA